MKTRAEYLNAAVEHQKWSAIYFKGMTRLQELGHLNFAEMYRHLGADHSRLARTALYSALELKGN